MTRQEHYDRYFAYNPNAVSVSAREIEYRNTEPQPFKIQIPLVEYFERVKRLKADAWQHNFCTRLQTAALNRHVKRAFAIIHAESQLGKSVIQAQIFNSWLLGHDPVHRIILATYNIGKSEDHSEVVIRTMQSAIHKDIFPNRDGHIPDGKIAKSKWSTYARMEVGDGQYSFKAVGLQSGITGSGFDTLVIDDPYATVKDAYSDTVRKNLQNFWRNDVGSRLDLHSNVFAMFHRYHVEDLAGFLLDTGDFDYWRYATVADGDYVHDKTGKRYPDPLDRQIGEYIAPLRKPPEKYVDTRKDGRVWMSMFQGKPTTDSGDFFNVKQIKTISLDETAIRRAECVHFVRAYDVAATSGGGDYTFGLHGGVRPDGRVTVFDAVFGQWDPATRLEKQKQTARADGGQTIVRIPDDPGSAGSFEAWATAQELKDYTVIAKANSGSKKIRAQSLAKAVNIGAVEFACDEHLPDDLRWVDLVKKAWRDFDLSNFDDPVDAGADMYNELHALLIKGLLVNSYDPNLSIINHVNFQTVFPHQTNWKIPGDWQIYIGAKISADTSYPTTAVMVARASVNANLGETLIVFATYREYDGDYLRLFDWMRGQLFYKCEKSVEEPVVWLHPDSAHYADTIRQKVGIGASVFDGDQMAGYTELGWYAARRAHDSRFNPLIAASGLYLIVAAGQETEFIDEDGLYSLRQELATVGFDDEGNPSRVSQTLDCLRMICYKFRTVSKPLTAQERLNDLIPESVRPQKIVDQNRSMTIQEQMTFKLAERQAKEQLKEEFGDDAFERDSGDSNWYD